MYVSDTKVKISGFVLEKKILIFENTQCFTDVYCTWNLQTKIYILEWRQVVVTKLPVVSCHIVAVYPKHWSSIIIYSPWLSFQTWLFPSVKHKLWKIHFGDLHLFVYIINVNGSKTTSLTSKYHLLSLTKKTAQFGTTWGWVNDDRFFIFGWTIPLSSK